MTGIFRSLLTLLTSMIYLADSGRHRSLHGYSADRGRAEKAQLPRGARVVQREQDRVAETQGKCTDKFSCLLFGISNNLGSLDRSEHLRI